MHPKRRYRPWHLAWRPLAVEDEELFDILVGRPWLIAGVLAVVGFVVTLLVLPRRLWKRVTATVAAVLVALGGTALAVGIWGTLFPRLRRVRLPIHDLPAALDGLRIMHLSDFHLGMPFSISAARRALRMTDALVPDMIVITGDFISYTNHLPLLRTMLDGIAAPRGVFAVFGNHDHKTDPVRLRHDLESLGVTVLENEHCVVKHGDARFVVAGVEDMWHGKPDLDRALARIPRRLPVLLLAHSPDYAALASRSDVAVQFAGHTHAGHIKFPLLGSLFLPRHGVRFPHGIHRVGSMWLVISNGLGGLPIRLGARADALLVTLRRA